MQQLRRRFNQNDMDVLAENVGFADATVEAQKAVDKPVMTFLVKEYGRLQAEQQTA